MLRPLFLLLALSFTAATRVAASSGGGKFTSPAAYCHAALDKSPQNAEIDTLTVAYRQLLVVVSRLGKPAEQTFPEFKDGMPGRLTENEILRTLRGYIGRASAATKLGGMDEKLGKLGKAAIVAKGTWLTVRLRWLDTRIRGWALLKSPSKWPGAVKSAWQGMSNWVAMKWAWVRGKRFMGNQHIDEADKLAGDMAGAWQEQQPDMCAYTPPPQQNGAPQGTPQGMQFMPQQGTPQFMPQQGTPQFMPQQGMQFMPQQNGAPQFMPQQQGGSPNDGKK